MLKDKLNEHFSKGISVHTLQGLVKNTAPFIFDETPTPSTRYIEILSNEAANAEDAILEPLQYFEFCIAAHFATVGTFVPTDVDVAIREKLWRRVSTPEELAPMWKLTQEFLTWDESLVSKRWVKTPGGLKVSGHQGEWFSIAMGAYGTAVKKVHTFVPEIRTAIEAMVKQQEDALKELREQFQNEPGFKTAHPYFDAIAAVIHNLGDLDRMFDAWEIGEMDVLKRRVYRCGHEDARNKREEFLLAGKIYQDLLAAENHRHFALREPKCIRRSGGFLLNFGPFLDEWGANLIKAKLSDGDLREVTEALIVGWKRLNPKSIYTCQGYARAIAGIMNELPNKKADLETFLSPALKKTLNESGLRTLIAVTRTQYEKQWSQKLLQKLNEPAPASDADA